MKMPVLGNHNNYKLQPWEEEEILTLLGRLIWVKEMRGVYPKSFFRDMIRTIRKQPIIPYEGSSIKTFTFYFKSQDTGLKRWNLYKNRCQIGRGVDEYGMEWILSPMSDLSRHWASPANSHWVLFAKKIFYNIKDY